MKIKTNELIGPALDWVVAKCESLCLGTDPFGLAPIIAAPVFVRNYKPSTDWSVGGPIIEREGIELLCNLTATEAARFSTPGVHADWQAFYRNRRMTEERSFATTPLIASMRCYVTSKLGDEVDIPYDLT